MDKEKKERKEEFYRLIWKRQLKLCEFFYILLKYLF
jgi:hypothetical protein